MSLNYQIVILLILSSIVYPGLIFLTLTGFISEWIERKTVARIQRRMGPSYTGPGGLLQPILDFLKLIIVKEEVVPLGSSPLLAKLALSLSIASLSVSMLLLPLSPIRFEAVGDVFVLIYLVILLPLISLSLAFIAYPNPYVAVGFSRFISLSVVTEPSLVAALLTPCILASRVEGAPFTIRAAIDNAQELLVPESLTLKEIVSTISMLIALLASIVATQAKLKLKPFDVVEAEQELIAGPLTEMSGPTLGLFRLNRNIEFVVHIFLISYILLGGSAPFSDNILLGFLAMLAKFLGLLFVMVFIRSVFGRVRIEESISIVVKFSLIPALVGLALACIL